MLAHSRPSPPRSNLPFTLTSFIGRVTELSAVRDALSRSRLVTLTGAGGVGKTRIGLEVARQTVDEYEDGAWLVELASLANPDLLPEVVLAALGLETRPGRTPTASLTDALCDRHVLLLLDNCEHLVESCARLIDVVLSRCRRLRILATSREVLGLVGETTWRVPSMTTPDPARAWTVVDLQRLDVTQLFLQRAQASDPGFRITNETVPSVARICTRLDGIPLAVELAAARLRTMTLPSLDEQLDDRFRVLTTGSRAALPRQRTLRATLDWSHQLLTCDEQRLFRRLSVFRGGFTVDAMRAVCARGPAPSYSQPWLLVMSELVDKSLAIRGEARDRSTRYTLLETVRDYAAEQLRDAGESVLTHGRHAAFFCRTGEEVARGLRGTQQPSWFARLEEDADNLRACLGWTLQHCPRRGLRLAVAMERHWVTNARDDGRHWLARALDAAPERDELRAYALYVASQLASFQGDFDEGWRLGTECSALARALRSDLFIGQAFSALGISRGLQRSDGWQEEARRLFENGEPYIRATQDGEALRRFLNNRAFMLHLMGATEEALPIAEESLLLARSLGDLWGLSITLSTLAEIEFALGATAAATEHWREQLRVAGEIHNRLSLADALLNLARIDLLAGEPIRCLRLLAGATTLQRQLGSFDANKSPEATRLWSEARATAVEQIGVTEADVALRDGAAVAVEDLVQYALGGVWISAEDNESALSCGEDTASAGVETFIREGEFWTIGFAGNVVRLKDRKGLQDIARLLGSRGREIAAVDMAALDAAVPATSPTRRDRTDPLFGVEGDAGPLIDAEARRQYRYRLVELDEEVADARANNDPERAARARTERDLLLAELSRAVGFGGRERSVLDPAERARKAVSGRIRDAIKHVAAVHPPLGDHLRRNIRTGLFCAYDPPTPVSWRLTAHTPEQH